MGLQGRLLLLLVPLLLVPVVGTAWVAYAQLTEQAVERNEQLALAALDRAGSGFEALRREAEASLHLLAVNPVVQRYLLTLDEELRYQLIQPALLGLFATFQEIHPDFSEIRVLMPDGVEDARRAADAIEADFARPRVEAELAERWSRLESGEVAVALRRRLGDGRPDLVLARKIELRDQAVESVTSTSRLYGFVSITVNLRGYVDALHVERLGWLGRLLLVDGAGRPWSSSFGESAFWHLDGGAGGRVLGVTRMPDGRQASYWSQELLPGFRLVALLPHTELFSGTAQLALWVILIALATLGVLILGISWILRRQVIFPLQRLGEAVRAITNGDGAPSLDRADTGEEIGHLVRAFQDMQQGLRSSREKIRRYQQELEQRFQHAEAAARAKSRFLANISHEIRTPMNAILGLTHLMQQERLAPIQAERLVKIDAAARHLLGILNDILDMSRIEAGRLRLEMGDFDLDSVMKQVRDLMLAEAEAKGIRVEVEYPNVPGWLHGDATRLRQALLNFASNAVKFTQRGRILLRVQLLADEGARLLFRFEVEDTGVGIPADKIPSLFRTFEQADSATTRRFGGTGLGLAITRSLAELMGGSVGVESVLGEGSRFWFTARLERGFGVQSEAEGPRGALETSLSRDYAGVRVLVVEDDPIDRDVLLAQVSALGLRVDAAVDGREAIRMAEAEDYRLILMDLQMPDVDGLEASRVIQALPGYANRPILAITANAFDEDRLACLEAGMSDFVTKPITPEDLAHLLLKWLPGAESNGRLAPEGRLCSSRMGAEGAHAKGGERPSQRPLSRFRLQLSGVSIAQGSAVAGSREQLFVLLREFVAKHRRDAMDMREYEAAGKLDAIRELAHELRLTAETLGAYQISNVAAALAEQSDSEDSRSFPHFIGLISRLERSLAKLDADLSEAYETAESRARSLDVVGVENGLGVLNEALALLEAADTQAISLVRTHRVLFEQALGPQFGVFTEGLERFDLDKALALLQAALGRGPGTSDTVVPGESPHESERGG